MITVETTDSTVRVIIPRSDVPADRLNHFVESLRLEAMARKSDLSEEEAARLADEIKTGWRASNRPRFVPQGRRKFAAEILSRSFGT